MNPETKRLNGDGGIEDERGDALAWLVGQNFPKKGIFEVRRVPSCLVFPLDWSWELWDRENVE